MLRTKKEHFEDDETEDIQKKISDSQRQLKIRYEQTVETAVFREDTINSIAIRNNCLVSDIKRLNKIIQDNEIHAFHTIKVPLTAHNILIDTLPKVHKSGNNSPKASINHQSNSSSLDCKEKLLEEKLLLASVSNAVIKNDDRKSDSEDENHLDNAPLLSNNNNNNNKQFRGYPKSIKIPKNDLTFNGSDCELSWVFLLIVILAFCVIIPLIYVYAVYEHPENFNHSHVKYNHHNITNHL